MGEILSNIRIKYIQLKTKSNILTSYISIVLPAK